jgi:murein DD-endopeptidase MepM/ murein hydrolase activator NlpD
MTLLVERSRSRTWSCLAVFGAIAVGTAGCGPDTTRFNDPAGNPFAGRGHPPASEVTAAAPPPGQPAGQVDMRPLPPPPSAGVAGGGRGMASYQPAFAAPETTGSVPPAPPPPPPAASFRPAPPPPGASARPGAAPPVSRAGSGWEWDGGTPIIVGSGDTIDTLSRKYGVPSAAIMQANGITNPAAIKPGHRLVIPRSNAAAAPPRIGAAPAAPAPLVTGSVVRPGAPAPGGGGVHVVAPKDTLHSIARRYGKPVSAIATANKIPPDSRLKVGDRLVIPGVRIAAPAVPPAPPVAATKPAPSVAPPKVAQATPPPAATPKATAAEAPTSVRVASAVPDAPITSGTVSPEGSAGGSPTFRWPVRGRVIAGFGPKPTGQQNDGINLAVPEGTPVKAAEDGVVAYAGNELKGYGNLVLVRHSNGYVTAYAHASELMVKRGDAIKRGQVIAKSGQTGSVTSPQLHFEIRKGAAPVDPVPLLDKNAGGG